jgi:hypothetical protein
MPEEEQPTRQDRRAEKLRRKKTRMKKHGRGLAKLYSDALKKKRRK